MGRAGARASEVIEKTGAKYFYFLVTRRRGARVFRYCEFENLRHKTNIAMRIGLSYTLSDSPKKADGES
jgi:hypothetical protein